MSPVSQGDTAVLEGPTLQAPSESTVLFPQELCSSRKSEGSGQKSIFSTETCIQSNLQKPQQRRDKMLNNNGRKNSGMEGPFPLLRLVSWGLQFLCGLPGLSEGRNLPVPPTAASFGTVGLVPILATTSCVFKHTRGPARSLRNVHLCGCTGPLQALVF